MRYNMGELEAKSQTPVIVGQFTILEYGQLAYDDNPI